MLPPSRSLTIAFISAFLVSSAAGSQEVRPTDQTVPGQPLYYTSTFEMKKILEEHCKLEYSATCLKADVAALVPPLSSSRSFRLLPGLVLEMGGFTAPLPQTVSTDLSTIDTSLDRYLVKGMDGFINSLALRVKVVDKSVAEAVRNIGITISQEALTPDSNVTLPRDITGRRRRVNQALMMGGMVSAGTLLALTMSAISAMAGKAMLVSLLSLVLTLLNGRGGGANGRGEEAYSSGGKVHTYEVVHTVPSHEDAFTKAWAQTDPLGEATHHFIKPLVSHMGGRRVGVGRTVDISTH